MIRRKTLTGSQGTVELKKLVSFESRRKGGKDRCRKIFHKIMAETSYIRCKLWI